MAERDRRLERRLRYVEEELRYCQERARQYTERATRLEQDRAELQRGLEPPKPEGQPGGAGEASGAGLAELVKALNPETLKQIGEAVQGIDLQPILSTLGGTGLAGLTGLLGGASGAGAGGGLLGALGGASGAASSGGNPLEGLSEVVTYLSNNPLKGKRWDLKDISGAVQLLRSPNVQALLAAAGSVAGLAKTLGKGKGKAGQDALPAGEAQGAPSGGVDGAGAPTGVLRRFRRPEGPPPVVEPWNGGSSGQWVWLPENAPAQ